MADITTGLPTLRPEELQAQQDRARLAALRSGAVPNNLFTFSVPENVSAAVERGLSAVRGAVPVGGRGPSLLETVGARAQDIGALSALPAMMAPPPSGRGQEVSFEPAFAPPAANYSNEPRAPAPAPTPRTPKSAGTKTAGAMPAGAPDPLVPAAPALIPGETGYYVGDELRPFGTTQTFSGGGRVGEGAIPLPMSPYDMMRRGYDMQLSYLDEVSRKIGSDLGYMTFNGKDPGYAARAAAISRAAGNPDFAATGMSGANTINTNQTNERNTGVKAATDVYGFDQNLAGNKVTAAAGVEGHRLSAGGTVGAAKVRAAQDNLQLLESQYQHDTTPRPSGQTSIPSAIPGMPPTTETSYALPPVRGSGGMPRVIDSSKPKPALIDGTTGTDKKTGKATVVKNGQWVYQ